MAVFPWSKNFSSVSQLILWLALAGCQPPVVPSQGALEKPVASLSAKPTVPPELAQVVALQERLARLQAAQKNNPSSPPSDAEIPPLLAPSAVPTSAQAVQPLSVCAQTQPDEDQDGLSDTCEQELAEKWAPVVYHSSDETNYPTSVDLFLTQSALWFYDESCTPDRKKSVLEHPTQAQLLEQTTTEGCRSQIPIRSDGTRSKQKQRTYYLADVASEIRKGSTDTRDWRTYVHSYANTDGGMTLQYWRFYAYNYNDSLNNHGGDWEGVHVILDAQFKPIKMALLGHTAIETKDWTDVTKESQRPVVFSEGGGHASQWNGTGIAAKGCSGLSSLIRCRLDLGQPATFIRQETWRTGQVTWFDGKRSPGGGLLNVGEKQNPLNGQAFIRYSGLWGSPGLLFGTSGDWGPAYNQTGIADDGRIMAWSAGMVLTKRSEAYPTAVVD